MCIVYPMVDCSHLTHLLVSCVVAIDHFALVSAQSESSLAWLFFNFWPCPGCDYFDAATIGIKRISLCVLWLSFWPCPGCHYFGIVTTMIRTDIAVSLACSLWFSFLPSRSGCHYFGIASAMIRTKRTSTAM
mmetsp:Transcript_13377/g.27673  ORF Transcript_13377/g.27673 Transcript_13377/m.27673 type:complete len:132 (-) Transcript_13377:839-1234(-)